jgi:hypothetical protein
LGLGAYTIFNFEPLAAPPDLAAVVVNVNGTLFVRPIPKPPVN